MSIAAFLIVIGIVLALLVNWTLGLICLAVGVVLLVLPRLRV